MAHEIGHNLGMFHDFENGNLDDTRYSSTGESCSGIGGYMDYKSYPNKWSKCSVEDFQNYFARLNEVCLGKYTDAKFASSIYY